MICLGYECDVPGAAAARHLATYPSSRDAFASVKPVGMEGRALFTRAAGAADQHVLHGSVALATGDPSAPAASFCI